MTTLVDAAAALSARITDRRNLTRSDERLVTELANVADALALLCRLQAEAFEVPGVFAPAADREAPRYGPT